MSAKIILILSGSILLLLGLLLLITAKQNNFESKEYKKITKKDAPKKIGTVSYIIGGLLSAMGLILVCWGIVIHTGHLPNHEIVTTQIAQPKSKFM